MEAERRVLAKVLTFQILDFPFPDNVMGSTQSVAPAVEEVKIWKRTGTIITVFSLLLFSLFLNGKCILYDIQKKTVNPQFKA